MRAVFCAAHLVFAGTLAHGDVTLTSPEGGLEISGPLLSYDGQYYRVDTIYGPLTVDGTGVTCAGDPCPDLTAFVAEITISGAASMGEVLLPSLVEAFARRQAFTVRRTDAAADETTFELQARGTNRTVLRITFHATRSDESFADLVTGDADIAFSLREVRAAEVALAQDAGLGNLGASGRSRIVALDAMVPLVASDAQVSSISLDDLVAVVAGDITNWADLGGSARPINLHLLSDTSGPMQAFADRVLTPADASAASSATRHRDAAALAAAVSADPNALGLGLYSMPGTAVALPLAGSCGFINRAEPLSIKTEDYPLAMPIFLYLAARRFPPVVQDFLNEFDSPGSAIVIRRIGFVENRITSVSLDAQGERLANAIAASGPEIGVPALKSLVQALRGTERLSIAFRFEGGTADLDTPSRANIRILAEEIARGRFDGRTLIFAGFSDSEGPAGANQRLAQARAGTVRDAVQNAARLRQGNAPRLSVVGFGEAMPVACNADAWGRTANRRVEVWIK